MSISRRELLAGAAAAAVLPPKLFFTKRAGEKNPIVGSGEHTYEVIHDWLTPPAGTSYGDTHGLARDKAGNIYVAHTVHPSSTKPDAVVVFDQKGKFVESWGSEFAGGAHGLELRSEGSQEFIYHCDTRRRLIVKTDLHGKKIWEKGVPTESGVYKSANQWCPTNIAFLPGGDFFVGDGYGSSYVHRYSQDGDYRGIVCRPGREKGKVSCPHGLMVDMRGGEQRLLIADRSNHRLQYFSLDGQHEGFVTEGIRAPCHLHTNGGLMLVPDLDSVVTILDKNNKVVASLGDGKPSNLRDAAREKFIPGRFIHPHSAIWINDRDIVVAEWVPIGRVTLLRKVHA